MKFPHDRVTVTVGRPASGHIPSEPFRAKNVRGGRQIPNLPCFPDGERLFGKWGIFDFGMRNWNRGSKKTYVGIMSLAAAVLLALTFACDKPDDIAKSTDAGRFIKDDLGREVRMPLKLERAVSLAPSITELVFAAGAGDKLVGVTTYCDFPAEARSIQKIGDTQTPNIESIIALKPLVVFVSTASQLEAFAKTLEEQSIAVYVVDVRGIDDVPNVVRQIGEFFGTLDRANSAADSLFKRMEAARANGTTTNRPRVFVQLSEEPLFTIGRDSFLTALIERAGGLSATGDLPTGYPKLSKETASALHPDVIILSASDDNQRPNDVFRDSPAVKTGRVFKVNADILSRPGPRLVDALEEISKDLTGGGSGTANLSVPK